jgi:adenylosuccinate synthase
MVNGIDELAITNLDGLDGVDKIKICVAYKLDGKKTQILPTQCDEVERCQPVYIEMPGWLESTENAKTYDELPVNARRYVEKISELTGAKTSIISVGAARAQTIRV